MEILWKQIEEIEKFLAHNKKNPCNIERAPLDISEEIPEDIFEAIHGGITEIIPEEYLEVFLQFIQESQKEFLKKLLEVYQSKFRGKAV